MDRIISCLPTSIHTTAIAIAATPCTVRFLVLLLSPPFRDPAVTLAATPCRHAAVSMPSSPAANLPLPSANTAGAMPPSPYIYIPSLLYRHLLLLHYRHHAVIPCPLPCCQTAATMSLPPAVSCRRHIVTLPSPSPHRLLTPRAATPRYVLDRYALGDERPIAGSCARS